VRIYVNRILVKEQVVTGFAANTATVEVGGDGHRQIRCLYLFNQDLSDGGLSVGGTITSDLYTLHQQDTLMLDLPEGQGIFLLPPVMVRAGRSVECRFQPIQLARQEISAIGSTNAKAAQVVRVTVQEIANASAAQTDWIVINSDKYGFESDATPTKTEIAAGLAAKINATPKRQPVTAVASGDSLTLTADNAGYPFSIGVSPRLSKQFQTQNAVDILQLTVPAATDFSLKPVLIFREGIFIAEGAITAINTGLNRLTFRATTQSAIDRMAAGDVIILPRWQLLSGRNSYFVHHLEDFPDIKPSIKELHGFTLRNYGKVDRTVTPYFKIAP
jgi:hypothetical protein